MNIISHLVNSLGIELAKIKRKSVENTGHIKNDLDISYGEQFLAGLGHLIIC